MHKWFLLLSLIPLILTGILSFIMLSLQLPLPWHATAGGIGLSVSMASWFAIYLRVRHELPNHPLAKANYITPRMRDWNVGIQLVLFYLRTFGLDVRSGLLLIGMGMLLVPVVRSSLEAIKMLIYDSE
ncbi:MAG: hypothetical protein ACREEP_01100 [Dongiaceae bacterium]